MQHVHAQHSNTQDVLRPFNKRQRLVTLVNTLAKEVERLDEDNAQLRAAVSLYREVARRSSEQFR
jgi:outer membrane murein-binding lipoprotein Lpp